MVFVLVTLESVLRFSLLSTNVAVPNKMFGKMLALHMILHLPLQAMAETTTDAFVVVPTFSSNNILQQVFMASHK